MYHAAGAKAALKSFFGTTQREVKPNEGSSECGVAVIDERMSLAKKSQFVNFSAKGMRVSEASKAAATVAAIGIGLAPIAIILGILVWPPRRKTTIRIFRWLAAVPIFVLVVINFYERIGSQAS